MLYNYFTNDQIKRDTSQKQRIEKPPISRPYKLFVDSNRFIVGDQHLKKVTRVY